MTVVLDSWAVLRYLENTDPTAGLVAKLHDDDRPLMSSINRGEVHYVLRRSHGEDDAVETVRAVRDVIDVRLPDERLVARRGPPQGRPSDGLRRRVRRSPGDR